MTDLDTYFKTDKTERDSYPLIRLLDAQQGREEFHEARVEIIRPCAALGFEPARLSLQFFDKQAKMYDYKTEPWDAELNEALIEHEIRAVNADNEIQRFGLGLGASFEHAENRYGDGFFSAVLMQVVQQSPFATMEPVRELTRYIKTNKPHNGGHSADDCTMMIQAVLQDRWLELRKKLNYEKSEAERILGGALAYYLDERFSITDGRKLGWVKS